jgi:hypothetical protein
MESETLAVPYWFRTYYERWDDAEKLLTSLLYLLVAGCATALPEFKGPLGPGEEFITLATRPGVTVRVLLISPKAVAKGIFVFFSGGEGHLVGEEGRPKGLFLPEFREQGFITALVDVPSDQPYGMIGGDRFRRSKEPLDDVKTIINFVYQKWPKPIFLIGHSAGATSAAYIATALKDLRIGGIVLTSPVGDGSLAMVALHIISYPVLFVHHRNDPCTSFEAALRQHQRLINSPRVGFFIEVSGGDQSRAIGCKPRDPRGLKSYEHGFSGKRREVVMAIADWVTGKPVPDRIGP